MLLKMSANVSCQMLQNFLSNIPFLNSSILQKMCNNDHAGIAEYVNEGA